MCEKCWCKSFHVLKLGKMQMNSGYEVVFILSSPLYKNLLKNGRYSPYQEERLHRLDTWPLAVIDQMGHGHVRHLTPAVTDLSCMEAKGHPRWLKDLKDIPYNQACQFFTQLRPSLLSFQNPDRVVHLFLLLSGYSPLQFPQLMP